MHHVASFLGAIGFIILVFGGLWGLFLWKETTLRTRRGFRLLGGLLVSGGMLLSWALHHLLTEPLPR